MKLCSWAQNQPSLSRERVKGGKMPAKKKAAKKTAKKKAKK
jgi:hypothetical protein